MGNCLEGGKDYLADQGHNELGGVGVTYRLMDGIEFLKSLPDRSVDGIFTDPPWGSGRDIEGQAIWKELLIALDKESLRILRPRARVLIWIGGRMLGEAIRCFNHLQYQWFFVVKYVSTRYFGRFFADCDPILYFSLPGEKIYCPKSEHYALQFYFHPSVGKSDTLHPCARPFNTVKSLLNSMFEFGEYVVDPFAGSDTTGRAARELNLKWDSCEIDPKMYKTGIERHAQGILFEDAT